MNYVQQQTGYLLSFSDLVSILGQFPELRLPGSLVTQRSALCMAAKSTTVGRLACTRCKYLTQRLAARRQRPWVGICDVGVQEIVWPVWYENTLLGTLHFGLTLAYDSSKKSQVRREHRSGKTDVPIEILNQAAGVMPVISSKMLIDESRYLRLIEDIITSVLERHHWMPFHFLEKLADPVGIRKNSVLVRRAFDYVKKKYSEAISAGVVAAYLGYDSKHFSRIFSRDAGVSFHKFLALYRIEIAKRLLRNTLLSVTEISEKVGFQDSNYFSSTFGKIVRESPSHFRAKHNVK